MLPLPVQFLAALLAMWLGRVTVAERRRLAVLGKQMGRKVLAKVAIAKPETILRWGALRNLGSKVGRGNVQRITRENAIHPACG